MSDASDPSPPTPGRPRWVIPAAFVALIVGGVLIAADRIDRAGRGADPPRRMAETAKLMRKVPGVREAANFPLEQTGVPVDDLRITGVSPRDIPALSGPRLLTAAEAVLSPDTPVIGVSLGDAARAYPLDLMRTHQAVNDRAGDAAIVVTYCPVCEAAAVFNRPPAGGGNDDESDAQTDAGDQTNAGDVGPAVFAVSGVVLSDNLLLYDEETRSLWSQVTGRAVTGPRTGQTLTLRPSEVTTWSGWKSRHPDTLVMGPVLGTDYDKPLIARDKAQRPAAVPAGEVDDRLPPQTLVIGVAGPDSERAYPVADLRTAGGPVEDTVDGRAVTLEPTAGGARAASVGQGLRTLRTRWKTWSTFYPETSIYEPERRSTAGG